MQAADVVEAERDLPYEISVLVDQGLGLTLAIFPRGSERRVSEGSISGVDLEDSSRVYSIRYEHVLKIDI